MMCTNLLFITKIQVNRFENIDDFNRVPTHAGWSWTLLQEVSRFVKKRRYAGICRLQ